MKNFFILFLIAIILSSCGHSRKLIKNELEILKNLRERTANNRDSTWIGSSVGRAVD